MLQGFILSRSWRDLPKGVRVELWLATEQGPVRVFIDRQEAVFFIARENLDKAKALLGVTWRFAEVELRSWENQALIACYNRSQKRLRDGVRQLSSHLISMWEGDIRPPERFLMERFVTAGVELDQAPVENKQGLLELYQPRCKPSNFRPQLSMLSIDIETCFEAKNLYSIGVYGDCTPTVFLSRDEQHPVLADTFKDPAGEDCELVYCDSQEACLQQFLNWLQRQDPDVIIGWNFVQFDLWVLQQMCLRWGLRFALGRDRQEVSWREANQGEHRFVTIPGRVALDGIDLLKSAFYDFESFALDFVASELLGEGKLIHGDNRAEAISQQYFKSPLELCQYNIKDCQLVWDIFKQTRLLDFAIERSQLTGLSMDKAGGSVAAFEYAYLPLLHRAGFVAPNLGELHSDVVSPGGYVMDSQPGLYKHVLVLDFKSLYPSIIRTFNIDPCAFWVAQHNKLPDKDCVPGFNGARFARQGSILPDIIESLWAARERAKEQGDQPLSQAIKIIMNSYYGVLGSPGCRFFDPRVCSSITLRGHEIITESQLFIEQAGYDVIYGDTDSLFIWLQDVEQDDQALLIGQQLAVDLNSWWQQRLEKDFALESALEVEFETHFKQFFMPTIRGSELGSKKRYAGLVQAGEKEELIFKGLEAVRSDWTLLAREFQKQLYYKVFKDQPYRQFIMDLVARVLAGECDGEMVYRKRLRRRLEDYQRNIPPHVQAARKLKEINDIDTPRSSWVEYVLTLNGPEPYYWHSNPQQSGRASQLDYGLYIERQLKPVADSILLVAGDSFNEITDSQMSLFNT